MDTAIRDAAHSDSYDKCSKYQYFMSFCDAHRCLYRAAVLYQSHNHALLSSSSAEHWVLSKKRAAAQVFSLVLIGIHSQVLRDCKHKVPLL